MASEDLVTDREWLIVGRVVKPHGVHGEVLAEVLTDFPERLTPGTRFGLGESDSPESFSEVFAVRFHKGRWLIAMKGIRDRDSVEEWRGRYLFLPAQAIDELPEGYLYEHDLVGLQCFSAAGEALGEVTGFDPGQSQSRLVIRRGQHEFLVPYVPEIVTEVDLEKGTLVVDAPRGLLDDDAVMATANDE